MIFSKESVIFWSLWLEFNLLICTQVLGFEEKLASRSSCVRLSDDSTSAQQHARSQSEPLSSMLLAPSSSQKPARPALRTHSARSRAPSDPFVDSNTGPSSSPRSAGAFQESKRNSSIGVPTPPTGAEIDALLLRTAGGERKYTPSLSSELLDGRAQLRTWTIPDLSNPELISLLSVFPPTLTRRALPRFPASNASNKVHLSDLEEGAAQALDEQDDLRVGSGILRKGKRPRSGAWRGNWWERFKIWLRSLFR